MGKRKFSFPDKPITEVQFKSILTEERNQIYGLIKLIRRNLNYEKKVMSSNEKYKPNQNTISICAGLLTFAIEEFGKLLLLKECKPKNSFVDLSSIKNRFFDHDTKFKIAKSSLRKECITIYDAYEDNYALTVIFDDFLPWYSNTEADFDTRLNIFNIGLDISGNILPTPAIKFGDLDKAVDNLYREFLQIKI